MMIQFTSCFLLLHRFKKAHTSIGCPMTDKPNNVYKGIMENNTASNIAIFLSPPFTK